jgi:hypothetical protein
MKIEDLGLSKDKIQQLIIDQAVNELLYSKTFDEHGDGFEVSSDLSNQINKIIKERIDQRIDEIGDQIVLPNVSNAIENIVLQETTSWGEKKGKPMSFTEYLVQRADAYMNEPVSHDGKTKAQSSGYNWKASTTRLSYMIDSHLQYSISSAMKKILQDANNSLANSLKDAVRIQLDKLVKQITVKVK